MLLIVAASYLPARNSGGRPCPAFSQFSCASHARPDTLMGMTTSPLPEDHEDAADLARLAEFFATHYPNGGTVRWYQHHLLAAGDFHSGWVDVLFCDHPGAMDWNWMWTIVSPDDEDAEAAHLWLLTLEHDVNIWQAWDPDAFWYAPTPCVITAPGQALSPSEEKIFSDAGLTPLMRPGWSSAHLSARLETWCREHLGRSDIFFHFDADFESPVVAELREQVETLDKDDLYQVADGVYASEQAMDFLLGLGVDNAAAVTQEITKRLSEYLPRKESTEEPPTSE